MTMDHFHTAIDGKPAKVSINGQHVVVQTGGVHGTSWTLDKSLTPREYRMTSGNVPAEFKTDEATGALTRHKTEFDGWQPVNPATDKQLATFSQALAIIAKVSSTPGFPASLKDALPDAHKALGLAYDASPQRG